MHEPSKADTSDVPVIDFSPILSKNSENEIARQKVSDEIFEAFTTIGFVSLINHGIDISVTMRAFEESAKFFALSKETKESYRYENTESNRGYIPMGYERLDGTLPDLKETFDIGYEGDTKYTNRWPEDELGPGFRNAMNLYFEEYNTLHLNVLRCVARGMGLEDPEYFTNLCHEYHENCRLLHYPEVDREKMSTTGQKRGGIHTDYGTVTLLSQRNVGGLRAQRLDGTWIYVPPVEGGICVNVGEMLQRWTNDILRATPHQVLDDDDIKNPIVPERFSIAFFCNANRGTSLKPIEEPPCVTEERPSRYGHIDAHEYITMRLKATITG